jgi:hypothetical protein
MLKHRTAFHACLVLVGAMYWWLIGWFASFWLRFVGLVIGRDRYNHLEQVLTLTWRHSATSGTVIFGFASALNLLFDILAIIPLYLLWSFWYRRRESYVEPIGGRHENV